HPARAHRDSAARPAISRDDERSAGDQQIRGRHETVNGALAGPISVVEEMFHLGIVHIDDREAQGAVSFHRPEANDAGRGLLVSSAYARQQFSSLRVQQEDEVCAISDHEVRLQLEDLVAVSANMGRFYGSAEAPPANSAPLVTQHPPSSQFAADWGVVRDLLRALAGHHAADGSALRL